MIVDLNCDMGEGFGVYRLGDDAEMLTVATSANIACGFHAGDPLVMHETLSRAAANGVQAGAHPSFLDLWGFGRRPIQGERPADIEKAVLYQVGALLALAQDAGCPVRHVKTHGAMGNMANEDADLALAVARAIRTLDRDLIFVVMPAWRPRKPARSSGCRSRGRSTPTGHTRMTAPWCRASSRARCCTIPIPCRSAWRGC